jgi:SAM-dependent methyltransferase
MHAGTLDAPAVDASPGFPAHPWWNSAEASATLGARERYRDRYWTRKDPILDDRLTWRAQTLRHLAHLLPGQSILELGCGQGLFARKLLEVTRGENPIVAATFDSDREHAEPSTANLTFVNLGRSAADLDDRQFDYVVAMDLLDERNCAWLLQNILDVLKPGGQVLFYESNPWNIFLKLRRLIARLFGATDPRRLLDRSRLYELFSEIGFIRVFAVFNDFVYAPLTPGLVWPLRNLSIILENTPGVRTMAGSILIHAQKPPRIAERPQVSLCTHESLRHAVSVVVPCHNEEMNVGPLVSKLKTYYDDYIHEIVLVDDNSGDRTRHVIEELAKQDARIRPVVRTPPNGVGRALRDGFRVASGDYVLSMDCDFQHLLPELRDLFDAIAEGHDVAVGSRFSRHSVLLNYPIQKIIANRGFHTLARILLWRRFRDLTNNLKLMRRVVVERLDLTQPGFAVNAETGLQPLLMGFSVKEVPIPWINRTPDMGASSFRLVRVGGGYWQVLFRLWLGSVFRRGR